MKGIPGSVSIRLALVIALLVVLVFGMFQLAPAQRKSNMSPMRELVLSNPQTPFATGNAAKSEDLKLTGPYTHKNLTIFLVHGPDAIKDLHVLTLAEALKEKKVLVREKRNRRISDVDKVTEARAPQGR